MFEEHQEGLMRTITAPPRPAKVLKLKLKNHESREAVLEGVGPLRVGLSLHRGRWVVTVQQIDSAPL